MFAPEYKNAVGTVELVIPSDANAEEFDMYAVKFPFGTRYVYPHNGVLPSDAAGADVRILPVDLAANALSLGAHVIECKSYADFVAALKVARSTDRTSVIYIQNDRYQSAPGYESWWDVVVAEVSEMPQVETARAAWEEMRAQERYFL